MFKARSSRSVSKVLRGYVKKEKQNCFGKVVSRAAWPMRKRWHCIHRDLEFVMREVGGGDEIWSLREAADTIAAAASRLRKLDRLHVVLAADVAWQRHLCCCFNC